MKYYKIISILLFSTIISFFGCNNKADTQKKEAQKPYVLPTSNDTNLNTQNTAENTGAAWHYTCSKGCAGGASSATNCSTCGTLLVHNQAFHNNTNNTAAQPPFSSSPVKAASNNSGVSHYICENGCAGGSGSAGNCNTCGEKLAHNAAFHQ